jgi:hypothetical protein
MLITSRVLFNNKVRKKSCSASFLNAILYYFFICIALGYFDTSISAERGTRIVVTECNQMGHALFAHVGEAIGGPGGCLEDSSGTLS